MRLSEIDLLKILPDLMQNDADVIAIAAAQNAFYKKIIEKIEVMSRWGKFRQMSERELDFFAEALSSLTSFSFSFGMTYDGCMDCMSTLISFFFRSRMWPYDDITLKSAPKNFSIVLAFAGLSTITKLSCINELVFIWSAKVSICFTPTLLYGKNLRKIIIRRSSTCLR